MNPAHEGYRIIDVAREIALVNRFVMSGPVAHERQTLHEAPASLGMAGPVLAGTRPNLIAVPALIVGDPDFGQSLSYSGRYATRVTPTEDAGSYRKPDMSGRNR